MCYLETYGFSKVKISDSKLVPLPKVGEKI
jgi:hypothetical protein